MTVFQGTVSFRRLQAYSSFIQKEEKSSLSLRMLWSPMSMMLFVKLFSSLKNSSFESGPVINYQEDISRLISSILPLAMRKSISENISLIILISQSLRLRVWNHMISISRLCSFMRFSISEMIFTRLLSQMLKPKNSILSIFKLVHSRRASARQPRKFSFISVCIVAFSSSKQPQPKHFMQSSWMYSGWMGIAKLSTSFLKILKREGSKKPESFYSFLTWISFSCIINYLRNILSLKLKIYNQMIRKNGGRSTVHEENKCSLRMVKLDECGINSKIICFIYKFQLLLIFYKQIQMEEKQISDYLNSKCLNIEKTEVREIIQCCLSIICQLIQSNKWNIQRHVQHIPKLKVTGSISMSGMSGDFWNSTHPHQGIGNSSNYQHWEASMESIERQISQQINSLRGRLKSLENQFEKQKILINRLQTGDLSFESKLEKSPKLSQMQAKIQQLRNRLSNKEYEPIKRSGSKQLSSSYENPSEIQISSFLPVIRPRSNIRMNRSYLQPISQNISSHR